LNEILQYSETTNYDDGKNQYFLVPHGFLQEWAHSTGIRRNGPESTGIGPESTGIGPESTGMGPEWDRNRQEWIK